MGEMLHVLPSTFFFAASHFHLGISHFLSLLFFLSVSLALSPFATSMKTLKLSGKKESALLLLFISESPGGYAIYQGVIS